MWGHHSKWRPPSDLYSWLPIWGRLRHREEHSQQDDVCSLVQGGILGACVVGNHKAVDRVVLEVVVPRWLEGHHSRLPTP